MGLMKTLALGAAALLAGALGGCTKLRLAYEKADWLIRYSLSDYVDWNPRQEAQLKREIADYLAWHRREALPAYAAKLEALKKDAAVRVDLNLLDRAFADYYGLYALTLTRTIPGTVSLLRTLSPEQVEELAGSFREKNAKIRRTRLDKPRPKQLDMRAEKMVETVEGWTGDLDRDQTAKVKEMSRSLPYLGEGWMAQRIARQERLLGHLRRRDPADTLVNYFTVSYTRPEEMRTGAYRAEYAAYEKELKAFIVKVAALLDGTQRKTFESRLERVVADCRELAGG